MRLLLFIAVWLLLQLLTPLRGLWALVLALMVSGAISFFLLNRQRDAMSGVVAGFFGRINDRINPIPSASPVMRTRVPVDFRAGTNPGPRAPDATIRIGAIAQGSARNPSRAQGEVSTPRAAMNANPDMTAAT
jgi:hypothetical protein